MITIEQVLEVLKKDRNFRDIIDQDNYYYSWTGVTFDHLSYDSRDVTPSSLFFAKGAAFKPEFLENAVKAGLSFYVAEKDYQVGIPVIIVTDIKQAMSLVAQAFYQYPQDKLKLLAFTGTKGKTTAAYFAFNILKQSHKPAMLSTMNTTLDGKTFFKSTLTTPESLDLFRMMAEAVDNGMTHLIMEVSSQAYLTKRVYGLTFDVGVFLNISPDLLDLLNIQPLKTTSTISVFSWKTVELLSSIAVWITLLLSLRKLRIKSMTSMVKTPTMLLNMAQVLALRQVGN